MFGTQNLKKIFLVDILKKKVLLADYLRKQREIFFINFKMWK